MRISKTIVVNAQAQVLHCLPADVVCKQGAADPVPARPTGAPVGIAQLPAAEAQP